jgi:hypothetical protein
LASWNQQRKHLNGKTGMRCVNPGTKGFKMAFNRTDLVACSGRGAIGSGRARFFQNRERKTIIGTPDAKH